EVPVAVDVGGVGVVVPKEGVGHTGHPHVALVGLPGLDDLGAGNHSAQGLGAAVGDAGVLGAGVLGVNIFPVNAGGHQHLVAGPGDFGRVVDVLKGPGLGAVPVPVGACGNIDFHGVLLQCSNKICENNCFLFHTITSWAGCQGGAW